MTRKEIVASVNAILKQNYPAITVESSDKKEGIKRPSFRTSLENVSSDSGMFLKVTTATIRIHYFPSDRDRYSVEIAEMADELEWIFGLSIPVGERFLTSQDVRSQEVDGVLEFDIDIEYTTDTGRDPNEGLPYMEDLEVDTDVSHS